MALLRLLVAPVRRANKEIFGSRVVRAIEDSDTNEVPSQFP
jgi:hypothetical protein